MKSTYTDSMPFSTKQDAKLNKIESIKIFNSLIKLHDKRIDNYQQASQTIQGVNLKDFFSQFILNSQTCKQELIQEIYVTGGIPVNGNTILENLLKIWTDLKAFLSISGFKNIFKSCCSVENRVIRAYKRFIKNKYLSISQKTLLDTQYALIKTDLDRLKHIKDLFATEM